MLYSSIKSFSASNALKSVSRVSTDVLFDLDEVRHQSKRVCTFDISETQNIGVFSAIDIVVDIDGVRMIFVDEMVALPIDDLVGGVSSFLSEHHVLQRGKGFSDLLRIVAFFIDLAPILPLVGVRVVLSSLLDLVLRPLFIAVHQENLFDVASLYFQTEREFS